MHHEFAKRKIHEETDQSGMVAHSRSHRLDALKLAHLVRGLLKTTLSSLDRSLPHDAQSCHVLMLER